MCHLSPVTCYLSHVTCHLLPVICHMSPVTCHLSPLLVFSWVLQAAVALLSGGGVGVGDSLDNMDDTLVSRKTVMEVESLVPGVVNLPE